LFVYPPLQVKFSAFVKALIFNIFSALQAALTG